MKNGFEMTKVHALIDEQAFHLMEHGSVGLVRVAAVNAAWGNDPHRRFAGSLHGAHLHWRGMRAQQAPVGEIERVVHGTRRVVRGNVQGLEIVEVVFHLGAFRHGKPRFAKKLFDALARTRHRVQTAYSAATAGLRYV